MALSKTEENVLALAIPIAASCGCEVVDVEFKKEGQDWFLRFFIDKPEGITLDDCEGVSRKLSEKFDKVDPIPQSYILEVSSPGICRPLKKDSDYERFMGSLIDIKCYKAFEGQKKWSGKLAGYENGIIILELENGKRLEIERDNTSKVSLAIMPF